MVGGGTDTSPGIRARLARGRPNWWVILAVSLGLMALLVATAGSPARPPRRQAVGRAESTARVSQGPDAHRQATAGAPAPATSTRATTSSTTTSVTVATPTTVSPASGSTASAPTRLTAGSAVVSPSPATGPVATTTTSPPTTTSTQTPSVPADRTQTQGYLNPPVQASNQYAFAGSGAMDVSVVWSGETYLTMEVSCPSGDQSVGGSSAMAASLPDASGSCVATVSEPASESVSLTYTITIGPTGG